MKAHYLPQSYLANFTDPNAPEGQTPFVWVYEAGTDKWRARAPVNVAWERDYYVVTDENGVESNAIETELSRVEGEAARVINKLISEKRPFSNGDRMILATHMALMNVRMPAHHSQIRKFNEDMANITRQLAAQHGIPDPLAPTGALDPEVEEHNDILRLAFSRVEKQARVIAAMGWRIRVTKPPHFFGTCDFPVAVLNPEIPDGSFYGPGMLQRDAILLFPLTRTAMLFAEWQPQRLAYLPVADDDVENINLCSWRYGRQLFVAPKTDIPGADILLRTLQREREKA